MSTLESERLDRIEQHLKLLKEDSNIRSADIKEIKQALLGNALNDYKGLVWKISDMDSRIIDLEEIDSELKVYIRQAKVIAIAFTAALVTLIFKAFKA
jgi:hypothetical protein